MTEGKNSITEHTVVKKVKRRSRSGDGSNRGYTPNGRQS